MDRLTSIEIFVRAVELGSFTAVAEEKGISSQMVGKHIRGLEASLGTKLLNKSTRFQSQTTAGEQYYRRCKNILSELAAAEEDIYREMHEPHGHLKIVSGVHFGISLLSPLLARFQMKYPSLTLDLVLDNQPVDVRKDGVDVIFREFSNNYESLVAVKVGAYPVIPCASPEYLARYGKPGHPEELVGHQCFQHNQLHVVTPWSFSDKGRMIEPKVSSRMTFNSTQAMLAAALEGAGIALQPIFQVQELLDRGRLIPLLEEYPIPQVEMYMFYQPTLRHTARLTLLLEHLREELVSHV